MDFLCLAAIYNHGQQWIETLVQSMIDQDYAGRIHVVVIDDRINGFPAQAFEQLSPRGARRYIYVDRMKSRAGNLLSKYQHGLEFAEDQGLAFDAVCVIDDDDIYLSDHISQHAKVLQTHAWSYPEKVFSTYMHQFRVEGSGGRFWASSAYRRAALARVGDYAEPDRSELDPAFDQYFLYRMQTQQGEGGHQESPTYVYMWDMTQDNHSSGHIEEGIWKYREIPESPASGPLVPRYNDTAKQVFEMARPFRTN
jgi:glycosyltransferase involved in cell wall biosynthesis